MARDPVYWSPDTQSHCVLVSIAPHDPRPIYLQIVDEVRRALVLDTLAPDDPLPSVRQLAVDLRVNPNTVSQAYRELERQGVVHVRRGQGTFASETFATDAQTNGRERAALARRRRTRPPRRLPQRPDPGRPPVGCQRPHRGEDVKN